VRAARLGEPRASSPFHGGRPIDVRAGRAGGLPPVHGQPAARRARCPGRRSRRGRRLLAARLHGQGDSSFVCSLLASLQAGLIGLCECFAGESAIRAKVLSDCCGARLSRSVVRLSGFGGRYCRADELKGLKAAPLLELSAPSLSGETRDGRSWCRRRIRASGHTAADGGAGGPTRGTFQARHSAGPRPRGREKCPATGAAWSLTPNVAVRGKTE
jgi:hypothetical protein